MAQRWQVTGQHQETRLRPGGQGFENVWVVTYQTLPEMVTGNLEVPERLYSADYVRDQIDRMVDVVQSVHNL